MASTGFRVSNNALSQNERSKLTKRGQNENADSRRTEALPAKRAALGTLSTNNIRIQPFRAAKVSIGDSNIKLTMYLNTFCVTGLVVIYG